MNSRERNKSHARKTRERKKNHMIAFKARIKQLQLESENLRNRVDARYTASVLLGLAVKPSESSSSFSSSSSSGTSTDVASNSSLDGLTGVAGVGEGMDLSHDLPAGLEIKASKDLCGSPYSPGEAFTQALADNQISDNNPRVRRRGKYTPQERESIRRERNRIHAKKTRDKKKIFLEASEKAIQRLESDVQTLREYLLQFNMMSTQELSMLIERDRIANQELSALKDPSGNRLRSNTNKLIEEATILGLNGLASTQRYGSNTHDDVLNTPSLVGTPSTHHDNNGLRSLSKTSLYGSRSGMDNTSPTSFGYYNSSASSASSGVSDREEFDDDLDDQNEQDDPETNNSHAHTYQNEGTKEPTTRTRRRSRSRSHSETPAVGGVFKGGENQAAYREPYRTNFSRFHPANAIDALSSSGHTSGTLSSHPSSTTLDAMSSLSMLSQAVMNTSNLSKNDKKEMNLHVEMGMGMFSRLGQRK